jgi:hypothetical protein
LIGGIVAANWRVCRCRPGKKSVLRPNDHNFGQILTFWANFDLSGKTNWQFGAKMAILRKNGNFEGK